MLKLRAVFPLLIVAVLSLSIVGAVSAQDATTTPQGADGSAASMSTCDSSVILLYGLAQRYFGYTPSMESGVSSYTFDYGQYNPLFDMSTMPAMSGTDMSATSEPSAMATEDTTMSTPDTGGMGTTGSSTFLNPPIIADEDPSCTLLRSDLENFFATRMMSPDWDNGFRNGMGGTDSSSNSNG